MKKQIIIIGGGDTFENHEIYINFLKDFPIDLKRYIAGGMDWKSNLGKDLGDEYEVYTPKMPNVGNAQFEEWKIWFDKIAALLNDEVILIGHSLGANFLIKYLSENNFSKKILGVFLVSGQHGVDGDGYGLATFAVPEKVNMQTDHVFIYHSTDDPVVPFTSMGKLAEIIPHAQTRIFQDRKHINQEKFPELVADIKSL